MKSLRVRPVASLFILLLTAWGTSALPASGARSLLAGLPLHFEPRTLGSGEKAFVARARGYRVAITTAEAIVTPRGGAAIHLRFTGARAGADLAGVNPLPGRSHYLVGRDPARWRRDVPHFARVEAREVYPGVDLSFYGRQGAVEVDVTVRPGADPEATMMEVVGAARAAIAAGGDLVLDVPAGELRLRRPVAYQDGAHGRHFVACAYRLSQAPGATRAWRVGFDLNLAEVEPGLSLVIDPVLEYATYWGGGLGDVIDDVKIDGDGNIYVSGSTDGDGFPVTDPLYPGGTGQPDAFVSKVSPDGGQLLYSTVLGGSNLEFPNVMALGPAGGIFLAGTTLSTDFPVVNAFQPEKASAELLFSGFVASISAPGSELVYASYLGGSGGDLVYDIAADGAGNLYAGGVTASLDFPVANPLDATLGGTSDGFLVKVLPGGGLGWATYLGGSSSDNFRGIALDGAGRLVACGFSGSPDFPLTDDAFDTSMSAYGKALLAVLDAEGSALSYATFLGGTRGDECLAVAVDAGGNFAMTGDTGSTDFPVVNAFQPTPGDYDDVFVAVLNAAGSALRFSTYFGGPRAEEVRAIAVDAAGNIHIAGRTNSDGLPVLGTIADHAGGWDAFAARFGPDGTLGFSTFLGGALDDDARAVAVTADGRTVVGGVTSSADFPVAGGLQTTLEGEYDGFLAVLAPGADVAAAIAEDADPVLAGGPLRYTLTARNLGELAATGAVLTATLPEGVVLVSATPSQGECSGTAPLTCALGGIAAGGTATVELELTAPAAPGSVTLTAAAAADQADPRDDNDSASATTAIAAAMVGATKAARTVWESMSGFDIPVRLRTWDEAPSAAEIRVDYATADGTATAGQDFTATNGTLVFAAGSPDGASQTISVSLLSDAETEAAETFTVAFTDPQSASQVTPAAVTVTIQDGAPAVPLGSALILAGVAGAAMAVATRRGGFGRLAPIGGAVACSPTHLPRRQAIPGRSRWSTPAGQLR
ncbi:MAG: SBBP repeat-containing protein [Candidatus Schekmanbacteria bacterium]|nr:SBBP repeat-containing protein [Candidatus Schekmanbacteria bacterium]